MSERRSSSGGSRGNVQAEEIVLGDEKNVPSHYVDTYGESGAHVLDVYQLQAGDAGDIAVVDSHSAIDLRHPEGDDLHIRDNSELSTEVHIPEVFIYDYGTVVIWGMSTAQEQRFLNDMSKFSDAPLPTESVQTENFNFYYTKDYQARIYNDFISLRDPRNHMTKLAISHALAQSTKVCCNPQIRLMIVAN